MDIFRELLTMPGGSSFDLSNLEQAIGFALRGHQGQQDKAGAPYILHPLRLMLHMHTDAERLAALLHDVLEDTDFRADDLLALRCPPAVVEAVEALTRRHGESYEAFIARVKTNSLARKVKLADLEDNMNILRLQELGSEDLARLQRYHQAWHVLQVE